MRYKNILLIDDDTDDQELFFSALERVATDVDCKALNSGVEALKLLRAQQLKPDVIFLDLNMPAMTGQQFLAEIKRSEPLSLIPVIVLSTTSHKATIELVKELGANGFHSKPDKFEDLILILRSALAL